MFLEGHAWKAAALILSILSRAFARRISHKHRNLKTIQPPRLRSALYRVLRSHLCLRTKNLAKRGETQMGKSYGEESWQAYQSNYEDAERDAVAVMLAPTSSADISNVYESSSEEISALPLAEGTVFDEFAGEEAPRKKSLHQFMEQKRFEETPHVHSSGVVDELGRWREELRDSKAVKVFKHVVANYMTYRNSSPTRVMADSGKAMGAMNKPNVQANHLDFAADICICVRKAVSPSLYRIWDAFFVLSNGERAEFIPAHVFAELAELAGKQFLKSGLYPRGRRQQHEETKQVRTFG
jgi:hypothetical protein